MIGLLRSVHSRRDTALRSAAWAGQGLPSAHLRHRPWCLRMTALDTLSSQYRSSRQGSASRRLRTFLPDPGLVFAVER
jgi:hypothetical protein